MQQVPGAEPHRTGIESVDAMRADTRNDLETALKLKPGDKVLLFGGYGTSNVGDDAILSGLLSALPDGVVPTVVSMNPGQTGQLHRVNSVPPVRVPFELITTNAVIIGGGGIFSSHMGAMSKLLPMAGFAAWLLRKRVAFYGLGVYGSTPGWVKKSLRLAMKRAKLVTVRDTPSLETLEAMGVEARQVPDLAMLLDESLADTTPAIESGESRGRPTVLLCLTQTDPEAGDRMLEVMPEVIDRMPEVDFLFVPMSQHPVVNGHNDVLMAQRLQEAAPRMLISAEYGHPANVLRSMRSAHAAVCMRFHSMVFAERAGTPIVPVSYAPKTGSWLEERGLSSVAIEPDVIVQAVRDAIGSGSLQQVS